MSLFSELKRRNVFRVALLYLVASWVVIQVTDVGVSLLGLPDWTGRFVFLLLLIGFPLVMVFSWVYELTPEGLKREKEVVRDTSITHETARKLNTAVIVLLLIAVGGLIADRLVPETRPVPAQGPSAASPAADEQSIAVLPFVNMSSDPENEYFSDGLSEELLNLLAKIPELKVAARTSSFSFKNSTAEIGEIARTLQVAHVLEGSVRKSGDDIRITAQLIKASDGYHLWSETWDRTLVDVFAIQDEIAESVVSALKMRLLGEVPRAEATDPYAYELYLKAKSLGDLNTGDGFREGQALLEQALAIDPEFAEGWVELGVLLANQTGFGYLDEEEGYERAEAATRRALQLEPRHARAMSGLGWNAMYRDWDFREAARLIRTARELEPGNASVINAYAVLTGAFGRLDEQISLYESALERDPVALSVLWNLSGSYQTAGRHEDAEALIERMRQVSPESSFVALAQAFAHWFDGDAEAALDGFSAEGGMIADLGRALALYDLGRDDEVWEIVRRMESQEGTGTMLASLHAHRKEPELAFEWLERAFEAHDINMVEIRMYTLL
ncbi:MAG: hypothetical protein OEW59_03575, partial [Gammaproteobacteria bacterium]|nr:hypothetical protein [Gammaproteobacteria bacterium]